MIVELAVLLGLCVPAQGKPNVAPPAPGVAAVAAKAFWEEWATSHKYRMSLSHDERVLMLLPEERSKAERAQALVDDAMRRVDEFLPVPPREPEPEPEPADEWEEPEEPVKTSDVPAEWKWGDPRHDLDTDTIVLGQFRNPADYASALTHIGDHFEYLAAWLAKGKDDPGCILEQPLFGACVDNVPGMEEWNPDNELVHRSAQLAMRRRFGRQPVWLALGVGWNVEFDLLKNIYCFPWRNSFVSVSEHSGWENELKRMFAKREKQPLAIEELTACQRGRFTTTEAALAWGTIHYLSLEQQKELPLFLDELRKLRDKLGKKTSAGPTEGYVVWEIPADFEVPPADQKAAFERVFGADIFTRMSTAFRVVKKGKKSGK